MSAADVTRKLSRSKYQARYTPGEIVVVTMRIPAEPLPLYPPTRALVEETVVRKPTRKKDRFGRVEVTEQRNRVRVRVLDDTGPHAAHFGKSYWVEEDDLERT